MCLGIPGKVIEIVDSERGVVKTEVSRVRRNVSTPLFQSAARTPAARGVAQRRRRGAHRTRQ